MRNIKAFLKQSLCMSLIAIFLGLAVSIIIIAAAGYNPWEFTESLFYGITGSPKRIFNVLIRSTPIIFTGIGVAFALHTGIFNIGAEGQFIIGCIATVTTGILVKLPSVIEIPLLILVGTLAGAIYGGIIGILKAKLGVNEVISAIMLNWIALYFSNLVIKIKALNNSTMTKKISETGYTTLFSKWKENVNITDFPDDAWKQALYKTDLNVGIIAAIVIAGLVAVFLFRTGKGFELRAVGLNPEAARFTGINVEKNIILSMLISGGICGMGAAFYVTGQWPHALYTLSSFEGYGMNGLSVAFIAMGSPVGCVLSGLLFGGLLYGGATVQLLMGLPTEIINISIGIIVLFCSISYLFPELIDRIKWKRKRGMQNE